jgi:L-ascorbate metabolism protein UlaG (beta-lactamase superfamily)
MHPGDMLRLDGFDVLAHNADKKSHPPEQGSLGSVFMIAGTTYYHASDIDLLPSMFRIRCDVAFLYVGGHYTVARAGEACAAEVIVPINWEEPQDTEYNIAHLGGLHSRYVLVLERGLTLASRSFGTDILGSSQFLVSG